MGNQSYILNKQLNPVPIGAPGELCLSGAGVARGYLNDRSNSLKKFIPNTFLLDSFVKREESIINSMDKKNTYTPYYKTALPTELEEKASCLLKVNKSETFLNCYGRYFKEADDVSYFSQGLSEFVLKRLLDLDHVGDKVGLDFGCGSGEITILLNQLVKETIGIDIIPQFIMN